MNGLATTVLFVALLPFILFGCGGGGSDARSGSTASLNQSDAGGEKSVEGFGSEAKGPDRNAVLAAEQGYFTAAASRGYRAACSYLANSVRRSMAELTAGPQRRGTCAAILPALLAPQAYKSMRQQARGVVKRVRVEGKRAFVVFRAPGARLYQMPLVNENGEWKVGLLASAVLVPSPSTLSG